MSAVSFGIAGLLARRTKRHVLVKDFWAFLYPSIAAMQIGFSRLMPTAISYATRHVSPSDVSYLIAV
jgi:hypothetical protein